MVGACPKSNQTRNEGEGTDTTHVQRPHSEKKYNAPMTPKPSVAVSTATTSSTGGMDISLTTPSTVESTQRVAMKMPKRKRGDPLVQDRTLSSALRQLAAEPGISKGSADNPIDLDEYSPRRKPISLPKLQQHGPEPHKFKTRHKKLYKSGNDQSAPRAVLAPKPANGIKFTGHKGDDMHRMMTAKMTAVGRTPPASHMAPPPPPAVPQTNYGYGISFDIQYPLSAKYLAQPPATYQSPYAQYHSHMGVSLSGDSEDMLRKKALQHVRDTARPQRLRKMLSDDVDETSASDSGGPILAGKPTSTSSAIKRRKLYIYQDPDDHIKPLVAQTSLLASMLQVYHKSTDQKGMREDIGMLVTVQNQRVKQWMDVEAKKQRRGSLEIARARKALAGLLEQETETQRREKEGDKEVRGLLSAGSGMWGNGGVADAFAAEEDAVADDHVHVERRNETDEVRTKGVCGWKMVR